PRLHRVHRGRAARAAARRRTRAARGGRGVRPRGGPALHEPDGYRRERAGARLVRRHQLRHRAPHDDQDAMNRSIVRRTLVILGAVLILAAVVWLAARIPRTIEMFLIAAFVAFGAHPLVKRLEARMPRPAAIAVVYTRLLCAPVVIAVV